MSAPEASSRRLQRPNRRVVAAARGGPEVLRIVEEALPEPQSGQVRVAIKAAGVSFADLLMREGVHPETPRGEITLGWDIVGIVDEVGPDVKGLERGDPVAALPMLGGYADFICLRVDQLTPMPPDLDPAAAVALVMNYTTAYQMLHRSARVEPGQSVLIHGASGGIGTALLQLGRLMDLVMYGTASRQSHDVVIQLGGIPIDYREVDFVEEIARRTECGVHAVFDGIGGAHVWRSFKSVRPGGSVIAYGLTSSLHGGRLAGGLRHRFHGLAKPLIYGLAARCLPGRRKIEAFSIQRRMWRHPDWFREDLSALFGLLLDGRIEPLIATRMPLERARDAHERLGRGSVVGKIILECGRQSA